MKSLLLALPLLVGCASSPFTKAVIQVDGRPLAVEVASTREARAQTRDVHWGVLFDLCVEKKSELPKGHRLRKYTGRVVFAGNRTKNHNWEVVMFQELSSSPPAIEAGKACIAHGLFPGRVIEAADATQAYVQAPFCGTETCVILPDDQIPDKHRGIDKPVYRLKRALYGHPNSGGGWGAAL